MRQGQREGLTTTTTKKQQRNFTRGKAFLGRKQKKSDRYKARAQNRTHTQASEKKKKRGGVAGQGRTLVREPPPSQDLLLLLAFASTKASRVATPRKEGTASGSNCRCTYGTFLPSLSLSLSIYSRGEREEMPLAELQMSTIHLREDIRWVAPVEQLYESGPLCALEGTATKHE